MNPQRDANRVLGHSLSEEVYQRPTVQRQPSFMGVEIGSWREFWFGLIVILLCFVALFYAMPILLTGVKS